MVSALVTASEEIGRSFLRTSWVARLTRSGRLRDTLDEETADWRAVCGKTACTVRRAGRGQPFPTPIMHLSPANRQRCGRAGLSIGGAVLVQCHPGENDKL